MHLCEHTCAGTCLHVCLCTRVSADSPVCICLWTERATGHVYKEAGICLCAACWGHPWPCLVHMCGDVCP
jgi:hypothetical protein